MDYSTTDTYDGKEFYTNKPYSFAAIDRNASCHYSLLYIRYSCFVTFVTLHKNYTYRKNSSQWSEIVS